MFCILLVEFMLLIPSVIHYRENQVKMVEIHAELLIETLNSTLVTSNNVQDPERFSKHLQNHEMVKGFSICGNQACLVRSGELVDPISESLGNNGTKLLANSTRMEVTRRLKSSEKQLWIVLRVDSTMINSMVVSYIWKVLGLVALISLFVTIATLIAIAIIVINPIHNLRKTMQMAMEDPTQPTKYVIENNNQDEIGDLTRTFNGFLFDVNLYQDQLKDSKREVERVLSTSEARWKFALEGSGDGVWDWNPVTDEAYFSKQFIENLGYEEGEFINRMKLWNNFIHPNDLEAAKLAMKDYLSGKAEDYSMEQRVKNKSGQWIWMLSRGMVISRDNTGAATRMVGTHTNISAHKASEELIWKQVNLDTLTLLPNRRQFSNYLQESVEASKKENSAFVLMFLDLDNFKIINDTHGHNAGDLLLKEAACRLKNCIRKQDILSRSGGDEFTIILNDIDDSDTIREMADGILTAMAKPFYIDLEVFHITVSIGITNFPEDASTQEMLRMNADQAMYEAKALGRNRYQYFSLEMRLSAQTRMRTINELREAVKQEQFDVYYQPIVCFKTGKIVKAECLIRWNHPSQGLLGADSIIRLAEETNMIVDIGNWIFKRATEHLAIWRQQYSADLKISVNTSPAQFIDDGCVVEDWYSHMDALNLPYDCLIIEITEGLLLDLDDTVMGKLDAFRKGGVQVALDDFGTGYSSLAYLQKIESDFLKIDRSFVKDIMFDDKTKALCSEIIKIAHIYNTEVIAEGIETIEQSKLLTDSGCDFGQGFLYSKPVSAKDFETLLKQQQPRHSQNPLKLVSNDRN